MTKIEIENYLKMHRLLRPCMRWIKSEKGISTCPNTFYKIFEMDESAIKSMRLQMLISYAEEFCQKHQGGWMSKEIGHDKSVAA
jgi:hypothetical protein